MNEIINTIIMTIIMAKYRPLYSTLMCIGTGAKHKKITWLIGVLYNSLGLIRLFSK